MHSIKAQARRQAWYTDDDPANRTYNPFFKRANRRVHDEESGPRLTQLVSGDQPELLPKRQRSAEYIRNRDSFSVPERASTFPNLDLAGRSAKELKIWPALSEDVEASGSVAPFNIKSLLRERARRRTTEKDDEIVRLRTTSRLATFFQTTSTRTRYHPRVLVLDQILDLLRSSWINLLLPFIPIGFAVRYANLNPIVIFVMNFLAIFPTGALLGLATEEASLYFGGTFAGLLNDSFGNAAQLISSILLLKSHQIKVLQASLLGSILQNLLLMTGAAFLVGGLCKRRQEQYFNSRRAQTISMFMFLAVLSLVVPTCSRLLGQSDLAGLAAQSRGTAVIIIFSYALWMLFQLKTNRAMFENPSEKTRKATTIPGLHVEAGAAIKGLAVIGAGTAAVTGGYICKENLIYETEEEEDDDNPRLSLPMALIVIAVSTIFVSFNTEFVIDSVQYLTEQHHMSTSFMGIVILPLLSNETLTIKLAINDQMDASIALSLERCMQTALLVVPLIVLIGWAMGLDTMTLDFNGFMVAALFGAVITVSYVVQEGRSNWLVGALLIKIFVIIGLASYYQTV